MRRRALAPLARALYTRTHNRSLGTPQHRPAQGRHDGACRLRLRLHGARLGADQAAHERGLVTRGRGPEAESLRVMRHTKGHTRNQTPRKY